MKRFLSALLLLLGVALSLKSLREPDLWWMYRTGEWMVENTAVTFSDPFSYTMTGTDWFNVKWLYEVIMVLFLRIGGAESLFLLQAFITIGILSMMGRTSRRLQTQVLAVSAAASPPLAWWLVGGLSLLLLDFRMIARPEVVSQLMTAVYIFLLLDHRQRPSRRIFWLVPLQCLWTNLHEAYGIGMVLLLLYGISTWIEYLLRRRWLGDTLPAPRPLTAAIAGALVSVAIHPRTYQMWLHPFNIFGQLQDNKFTSELVSFSHISYWKWEAYSSLVYAAVALLTLLLLPRLEPAPQGVGFFRRWIGYWLRHVGMGYLAWLAALWVLNLLAYRNIPFFIIISTPIVVLGCTALANRFRLAARPRFQQMGYALTTLALLAAYGWVVSEHFYKWKNAHDRYGLQVLSGHNPVGAAEFIAANGLADKRCFADYLTSSYLLWRLQPDFKTFIDLRDLDIFPQERFYEFAEMSQIPPVFDQKDSVYQFDYVVLFRPMFGALHRHLIQSDRYEMVFLDPVAAVYVKNIPTMEPLIARYGYEQHGRKDILQPLRPSSSSSLSWGVSKLFNPFYQTETYADLDYDLIRSSFYQSVGQLDTALYYAQQSIQRGKERWLGNELLGNIYNSMAFAPGTPDSLRKEYTGKAFRAYDAALSANPRHVPALTGKATLWLQQRDFVQPVSLLGKALDIEPYNPAANQYMALSYKMMVNSGQSNKFNIEKWIYYTEVLNTINPDNPSILLDLGIAYCQNNDCSRATHYLQKVENVPGLPVEETKTMKRCLQKCNR